MQISMPGGVSGDVAASDSTELLAAVTTGNAVLQDLPLAAKFNLSQVVM